MMMMNMIMKMIIDSTDRCGIISIVMISSAMLECMPREGIVEKNVEKGEKRDE